MGSWLYPDWVGGPMPAADVPFVGPGKGHNSDFLYLAFMKRGTLYIGGDKITHFFTLGLYIGP